MWFDYAFWPLYADTGLPTKNKTSETTVQNSYCLFIMHFVLSKLTSYKINHMKTTFKAEVST